ncbi:hypothetical protein R50072_21730 [Simiduia litorea]|uniref:DUF4398 domain-containing protein n=1 Tax=Simiduia litorea TaxID=1435348 RepID=UPI0036F39DF2
MINHKLTTSELTLDRNYEIEKNLLVKFMALSFFLFVGACTMGPPIPNQSLQAAQAEIDRADRERVSDYALPDLNHARDKLIAAREAARQKNMVTAERLADQSKVSAQLASARAAKIKATQVNQDMIDSIDALKVEMQRHTGEIQ